MMPVRLGIAQVVERINCRIDQAETGQTQQERNRLELRPCLERERQRQQDKDVLDPLLRASEANQGGQHDRGPGMRFLFYPVGEYAPRSGASPARTSNESHIGIHNRISQGMAISSIARM